jgi:hypothetical protein
MTDTLVQDEIARINAKPTLSDFEGQIWDRAVEWYFSQPNTYDNEKQWINAFWAERLN